MSGAPDLERRFQLLIDSVSEYAIYMLDAEGLVQSWNLGAARIKGYSAEEIIGQPFSRFFSLEDRRAGTPERLMAEAREHGKAGSEG